MFKKNLDKLYTRNLSIQCALLEIYAFGNNRLPCLALFFA